MTLIETNLQWLQQQATNAAKAAGLQTGSLPPSAWHNQSTSTVHNGNNISTATAISYEVFASDYTGRGSFVIRAKGATPEEALTAFINEIKQRNNA